MLNTWHVISAQYILTILVARSLDLWYSWVVVVVVVVCLFVCICFILFLYQMIFCVMERRLEYL